jgi:hypothetical protein
MPRGAATPLQHKRWSQKNWALPGLVFVSAFAMSAACGSQGPDLPGGNCPDNSDDPVATATTATTGTTATTATTGAGGTTASSTAATTAASSGAGAGPAKYELPAADEIATRLHSCHKLQLSTVGTFLANRGVAIPLTNGMDTAATQVSIFGAMQTLGSIFGGSNAACEMADTANAGSGPTNDPLCPSTEVCFCNQSDKAGANNKNCLDAGGTNAPRGYCVSKPPNAGFLYFTGQDAFGVPKLDSRLSENDEHTTASALRLMDIFIQAAPQIVANIGSPIKAPACTVNGTNQPMFDASDGSCVEEAVSCLIGTPASDDHMLLCNLILQKATPNDPTDLSKKRNLAVAALLSAAHSCE